MVTFTGSTAAGRAIATSCARNFTRSSLELGGKSAAIICEDADLDVVMAHLPIGAFGNSGQVCLTLSRSYVHRSLFDAVLERSEEHTSELQSLMRISYAVFCLKKKTNTP